MAFYLDVLLLQILTSALQMLAFAMKMPLAPIQKDHFTVHAIKASQATALPVQVTCYEL